MKHMLLRFCSIALAIYLSGCIEFEEQTMSYHFDEASDSMRVFQDYRGIFGADAKGKAGAPLSGEERGQLESLIAGQRTFFFNNWIFEYDRETLEQARVELDETRKKLKDPKLDEEVTLKESDIPKLENLIDIVLANVSIANGDFYLDASGKLCAAQSVTANNVSAILAALNQCGPISMNQYSLKDNTSPADQMAIAKFAKNAKLKMIELDGNALLMRWPISQASYHEQFGAKPQDLAWLTKIREAGLGIAFADDIVTFTLGKKDDEITNLTLGFSNGKYTTNAIASARALHRVKARFDPIAAAEMFLLRDGVKK
jgi:hypothetical protein